MPEEIDAFITFHESWEEDGLGPDGLPLFRPVIMITKSKPLTETTNVAHEGHFEAFPEQFRLFEKERAARGPTADGYPLAMWPVITPADLKMLAVRDIVTVEQLAKLADRKADDVLPQIKALAKRAKGLIELQKQGGKFEVIINDLTAQRDALVEQLREAHATISAQNSVIGQMRQLPAAQVA